MKIITIYHTAQSANKYANVFVRLTHINPYVIQFHTHDESMHTTEQSIVHHIFITNRIDIHSRYRVFKI